MGDGEFGGDGAALAKAEEVDGGEEPGSAGWGGKVGEEGVERGEDGGWVRVGDRGEVGDGEGGIVHERWFVQERDPGKTNVVCISRCVGSE